MEHQIINMKRLVIYYNSRGAKQDSENSSVSQSVPLQDIGVPLHLANVKNSFEIILLCHRPNRWFRAQIDDSKTPEKRHIVTIANSIWVVSHCQLNCLQFHAGHQWRKSSAMYYRHIPYNDDQWNERSLAMSTTRSHHSNQIFRFLLAHVCGPFFSLKHSNVHNIW